MRGKGSPIFSNKQDFFLSKAKKTQNINKPSVEKKNPFERRATKKVSEHVFCLHYSCFQFWFSHKLLLSVSREREKKTFRRIDRKFLIWIFYLRQVLVWTSKCTENVCNKRNEAKQNSAKQEQQTRYSIMVMFQLLTCICRINEVVRRHSVATETHFSVGKNVPICGIKAAQIHHFEELVFQNVCFASPRIKMQIACYN